MKSVWQLTLPVALILTEPGFAQKLVDPNTVAPEFRAAAEKRRAEQLKIKECHQKVAEAKILPRDRPAHISQCLEGAGEHH